MQIPARIAVGGRLLVDGHEGDAGQHRVGAIPVVGIGRQPQFLVHHPDSARRRRCPPACRAGVIHWLPYCSMLARCRGDRLGVGQQAPGNRAPAGRGSPSGYGHRRPPPRVHRGPACLPHVVHLCRSGRAGRTRRKWRLLWGSASFAPAIDEVGGAHGVAVGPAGIPPQMEGELLVVLVVQKRAPPGQHLCRPAPGSAAPRNRLTDLRPAVPPVERV